MLSVPPATQTSTSPQRIVCAANAIALTDEARAAGGRQHPDQRRHEKEADCADEQVGALLLQFLWIDSWKPLGLSVDSLLKLRKAKAMWFNRRDVQIVVGVSEMSGWVTTWLTFERRYGRLIDDNRDRLG